MHTDLIKQFGATIDAQNTQPAAGQPTSRRSALGQFGKLGLGAAALAIPFVGMAEKAHAAKYNSALVLEDDIAILNYALTLEYLEYYFYLKGVRDGDIMSNDAPLFRTIRNHELAHVNLLTGAISANGGTPVSFTEDDFDFTPLGDPFATGSYPLFLALSQGLEDTGVRAYKGQAANIDNRMGAGSILTVALQIHSVEARHAAAVRMIRGKLPYITGNNTDTPALQATYAGEQNVTQGGVDLASAFSGTYSVDNITQSFDEPLSDTEVLAIATQFLATGEED